jgi:uncharacterized membrane protein
MKVEENMKNLKYKLAIVGVLVGLGLAYASIYYFFAILPVPLAILGYCVGAMTES